MDINLDGFTKTIIPDKTEYKELIKKICDEYFTPENFQNNLLLRLGAKLLKDLILLLEYYILFYHF